MATSIGQLTWQQFGQLIADAYRRQGYTVIESPHAGPDDEVDFVLKRNAETRLVRCREWDSDTVGKKAVRQMVGLVDNYPVSGGVIVTSGSFTRGAYSLALSKPVELVDGDRLAYLIGNAGPRLASGVPRQPISAHPGPAAAGSQACSG